MIGGISWANLQGFLTLAREERLTGAARKLGVDHTTLKRRIEMIENALGTILFERKPSGYLLTASGRRVLAILEEMESISLKLSSDFVGLPRAVQGTVRIAASDVFANRFLSPRIPSLANLYPDLNIELVSTPRSTSLTKREADLAITSVRPERGRLHSRKLTSYEQGLYCSRAYLAERPEPRTCQDLIRHRLVGYIDDLILDPEMNSLKLVDSSLSPTIGCTNLLYQLGVIRAGGGIGVMPCWLAKEEEGLVRVLGREVALERSYWLNFPSDMRTNATIRAVCDFIIGEVERARSIFLPDFAPTG